MERGADRIIECRVKGHPQPEITWENVHFSYFETELVPGMRRDEFIGRISFAGLDPGDGVKDVDIACIANNTKGLDSKRFKLIVTGE